MKCVAIAMLSVGAFAVQDTTPPVISLTLAGAVVDTTTEDGTSAVDGHAHHAHSCAVWTTADGQSVCPDPSCSTHDHHDGAGVCERVVTNINNDNDATDLLTVAAGESADKSVRSMWLYKYDKTDASGNQAETVTFELTMYDHLKPVFTIDDIFANDVSRESCNAGGHTPPPRLTSRPTRTRALGRFLRPTPVPRTTTTVTSMLAFSRAWAAPPLRPRPTPRPTRTTTSTR
jgi:hypothetical protein